MILMNTFAKGSFLSLLSELIFFFFLFVLCLNSVIQGRTIIFQIKKVTTHSTWNAIVVHLGKAAVNTVERFHILLFESKSAF